MQIQESPGSDHHGWALFALGFRPFFLLAGVVAVMLVAVWINYLTDFAVPVSYYPGRIWHAHEMLFGYTVAVIAGFLLTAVKNWTDLPTSSGWSLAGLTSLWLLGRVLPFLGGYIPDGLIAITDLAFLPLLAWMIGVRVLKRRQYNNAVFIVILFIMFLTNLMVHIELLGITTDTSSYGLSMMMFLILLLIVIMGGRVIPFFTERGVQGVKTHIWRPIEVLTGISVVLLALGELLLDDALTVWLALFAFTIHFIRLSGWYSHKIWQQPLVWVLQVGYGWIVAALGIAVLAYLGYAPLLWSWHAFTVGGLGGITLGMMARVSLGHTGRAMKLPRGMVSAFILINIAALIRVFMPMILPEGNQAWLLLSGITWVLAFLIFLIFYTSILLHARVDGRPG